jgi:hypothetical protein
MHSAAPVSAESGAELSRTRRAMSRSPRCCSKRKPIETMAFASHGFS